MTPTPTEHPARSAAARSMCTGLVILGVVLGLMNGVGIAVAETQTATLERVLSLTEALGYQIDAVERERYGLFPDCEGFVRAEFLLRDGSYWLRLSYRDGRDRVVQQSPLSETQFLAWRETVLAIDRGRSAPSVAALSDDDRRDGRLRMVTDVFLYGMWLYGPATISLFDVDSNRGISAIELLAGGGAFAGALTKTQDYRLGYARTTMVRWGNYAGTFYGVGLPVLLHVDSERLYAVGAMAGTPVGGYIAHRWSGHRRFGKGEADLLATGMWVGTLYGLALPYLAGVNDDRGRLYLGSAMTGTPAGVMLAARLTKGRRVNRGRAHLITLGGFVGISQALGVIDLIDDGADAKTYVWGAALGAPTGAWLGYHATAGHHHTLSRARMISVGAYAGGLAGQGVVFALGLNRRARTLSAMVGSVMGLWFTDRLTQDWGSDVTIGPIRPDKLRVELPSPAALLMLGASAAHRPTGASLTPLQLVRVSF